MRAKLQLENTKTGKSLTIKQANLKSIDNFTRNYKDSEELKKLFNNDNYDAITLYYIKNPETKEKLDIIYNDSKVIDANKYDFLFKQVDSDIEKARKLLYSSKDNLFLDYFLASPRILETANINIELINNKELNKVINHNIKVLDKDNKHYIKFYDLLKARQRDYNNSLKLLYADSLDAWKSYIYSLDNEDLYYYDRELRLLMNNYKRNSLDLLRISNLEVNKYKYSKLSKKITNEPTKGFIKAYKKNYNDRGY